MIGNQLQHLAHSLWLNQVGFDHWTIGKINYWQHLLPSAVQNLRIAWLERTKQALWLSGQAHGCRPECQSSDTRLVTNHLGRHGSCLADWWIIYPQPFGTNPLYRKQSALWYFLWWSLSICVQSVTPLMRYVYQIGRDLIWEDLVKKLTQAWFHEPDPRWLFSWIAIIT